jgi:hypothetical protein
VSDFAIVPYAEALHRPYVASTFVECMRATWPWSQVPPGILEGRLWPEVHRPGNHALVAVLHDDPSTICGWIVTRPGNEIVAGYVRRPLRRKWGIGRALADAGGIDFGAPVGVWFWTYACERMFRDHAGYGRLYHKVTDERRPAA